MDQLRQIVASIGCSQLMEYPTTIEYNPTLTSDAWELVYYLRECTDSKERVIAMVRRIEDYFSEYRLSREATYADMILRHLVIEALSYIPRVLDDITILELAVDGTSSVCDVILPDVNDPKSNKVDRSSFHESIYGPSPCEPISGPSPNVPHDDPNNWGASVVGGNRQAFGKEEMKDYVEASDPVEQAPIKIPNSSEDTIKSTNSCVEVIGDEDNHGHQEEECTPSAPYVRLVMPEDIQVWKSQPHAQLYSRSDTDRLVGMARSEWVAIALRALLTDRVSKYVKNAVSSYAIKDWQWLARLVERLAHRGIMQYEIEVVIIPIMDCGNDPVRDIYILSLNDHMDNSLYDHIMSSWGRSSATYLTCHSLEMNHSSSHFVCTSLGREYAKSPTEWGVIPAVDTSSCDSFHVNALVASGTHHTPMGWRKNNATYATYSDCHMSSSTSSPTKIKPRLFLRGLINKLLSNTFLVSRMCTSNPIGLYHLPSEFLKFFAIFFAMTTMVCLSSPYEVMYPSVSPKSGNVPCLIAKYTSFDNMKALWYMIHCLVLYYATKFCTNEEALPRSDGEPKQPIILTTMKSTQARQYVSALEASFGTYGMYLRIVSLKLESLSPKYDTYTFRDILEPAVSTKSQFRYTPLSSKEYGESISLARLTAGIITVREKGKYNGNKWEGTKYDIVTTGDGELTSMVTANNNNCILYTRYNNKREMIGHHSNNKPIETTKEYNCDLNVNKLVYRGVTGCTDLEPMDCCYETSLWPTACPRWSLVMNRRMCYKTRTLFGWPRAIITLL